MEEYTKEVLACRPVLLRLARKRVSNAAWAEDAVSETLLAALERTSAFEQRAKLQTWLVSILQHKLVDQIRRNTRELPLDDEDDDYPVLPSTTGNGDWPVDRVMAERSDPQQQLWRKQVMQQITRCLDDLPERQGQAIVLRDWLGHESAEVCDELGITANNLYVTLHRARASLRAALPSQFLPPAFEHPVACTT